MSHCDGVELYAGDGAPNPALEFGKEMRCRVQGGLEIHLGLIALGQFGTEILAGASNWDFKVRPLLTNDQLVNAVMTEMPVRAQKAVSTARVSKAHASDLAPELIQRQNGVGAFILQCKRLDFHYCDWSGSSRGIKYCFHLHMHSLQSVHTSA